MKSLADNKTPGMLLIVTGSTASGKDTIVKKLLQKYPTFSKITTTTSRTPRAGEVDGQDYYFVSKAEFLQMQQDGKFLETVEYSGNYYGTTKAEIKKVLNGQNMIWRIEPTMAARAKGYFADIIDNTLIVFITTLDKQTLVRRLAARGMKEAAIQVRFKTDAENWNNLKNKFEHIIINRDGALQETITQISKLIGQFL